MFTILPILPCIFVGMKTLILTRHAKSDWGNLRLDDYDRELNDRGFRDAPEMGRRLLERGVQLDVMVSSSAKRAEQTSTLLANAMAYPIEKIQWDGKLYHAPIYIIDEVVYALPNHVNIAMIVCHNPGITQFVNSVAGIVTDDLATCGMVAFTLDTDEWETFRQVKSKLLFYDYPKKTL